MLVKTIYLSISAAGNCLPFYDVMRKVTSVCLVPSSWPLGHPHSERHVSNLCCPTVVESRPARNIYNVPQIIIIVMYG